MLLVRNPPANAEDIRDMGLIPGTGRSPGGGNGNTFQYSCLENLMDRGVYCATWGSQGVRQDWSDGTKSQRTWLVHSHAPQHIKTRSASFLHSKGSSSIDSSLCRWHNMPLGASLGFNCSLESSSTTLKGATSGKSMRFLENSLHLLSPSPFPNYDLFPNSWKWKWTISKLWCRS